MTQKEWGGGGGGRRKKERNWLKYNLLKTAARKYTNRKEKNT